MNFLSKLLEIEIFAVFRVEKLFFMKMYFVSFVQGVQQHTRGAAPASVGTF